MVSLQDSHASAGTLQPSRSFYAPSPSSISSPKIQRPIGRSMRTIRSTIFDSSRPNSCSFSSSVVAGNGNSEILTDSFVDMRLGELASRTSQSAKSSSVSEIEFLDLSQAFSDFSGCSSDISGELHRLASVSPSETDTRPEEAPEPCPGFLQRESFSTEIIESISPEDLQPTVKLCVDGLQSPSVAVMRSAAAKIGEFESCLRHKEKGPFPFSPLSASPQQRCYKEPKLSLPTPTTTITTPFSPLLPFLCGALSPPSLSLSYKLFLLELVLIFFESLQSFSMHPF